MAAGRREVVALLARRLARVGEREGGEDSHGEGEEAHGEEGRTVGIAAFHEELGKSLDTQMGFDAPFFVKAIMATSRCVTFLHGVTLDGGGIVSVSLWRALS